MKSKFTCLKNNVLNCKSTDFVEKSKVTSLSALKLSYNRSSINKIFFNLCKLLIDK